MIFYSQFRGRVKFVGWYTSTLNTDRAFSPRCYFVEHHLLRGNEYFSLFMNGSHIPLFSSAFRQSISLFRHYLEFEKMEGFEIEKNVDNIFDFLLYLESNQIAYLQNQSGPKRKRD